MQKVSQWFTIHDIYNSTSSIFQAENHATATVHSILYTNSGLLIWQAKETT